MTRLPAMRSEDMTEAQREASAAFRQARGKDVFGPFVPLLRSPELMTHAAAIGAYLRYQSVLPPRLREFLILVTAHGWKQDFEWTHHKPLAIEAGVNPRAIEDLGAGRRPAAISPEEELLYDVHEELHRTRTLSDALFADMVTRFGEQGLVEALGIIGYYTMLAMVLNVAQVPGDRGQTPV